MDEALHQVIHLFGETKNYMDVGMSHW